MRDADTIGERLARVARGSGIGASIIHAFLTGEELHGRVDWREAAIALADAADRMQNVATDALTLAPAPLVLIPPCHAAQPCAKCQDERSDFPRHG